MKNIIPFKELAYTGGLTITGRYACMYVCMYNFFFFFKLTVLLNQGSCVINLIFGGGLINFLSTVDRENILA